MNFTEYYYFCKKMLANLKQHLQVIYGNTRKGKQRVYSLLTMLVEEDFNDQVLDIAHKIKIGAALTEQEMDIAAGAIIDYMDNERALYIINFDVWEGEETAGPVSLEGAQELESKQFLNNAQALQQQVKGLHQAQVDGAL